MKDTFGLHRVLEPKGAVPVTAWKLDNSYEIGPAEARMSVERINFEGSNFLQICNQCEYNESKMIQRIKDIVDKRGKLHNPFTDTGGMISGKIDEMGEIFRAKRNLQKGQEFLCSVTTTAIPFYIDEIEEIDFNYGQVKVKGYAIIFEDTAEYSALDMVDSKYALLALDEEGSVYGVANVAKGKKEIAIVGRDLFSTMLYCGAIRKINGNSCNITVIMDTDSCGSFSEEDFRRILSYHADKIYFMNISNAVESYERVIGDMDIADLVVNCENKAGSETVSIFLCKNDGTVFFTSMTNRYSQGLLLAECMKKHINAMDRDQYMDGYDLFTAELICEMKDELEEIDKLYESAAARRGLSPRIASALERYKENHTEGFVYASNVTGDMVDEIINVAKYDCNVIIQGETGVGKEKVMQLIHKNSVRNDKPCIKVNCATIQENLAESEFFGYEEGSFTGAQSGGKKGYFELANNGILFLDEIGALSLNMQTKLLRVLQENQFYRVGGTKQINVNVRVICANNIALTKLVEEGKFREDLYYRLNICMIQVPPLRERKEDIHVLTREFLDRYNKKYDVLKEISEEGYRALDNYDWPGNVRELENAVHRLVINSRDNLISGAETERLINQSYNSEVYTDRRNETGKKTMDFDKIIADQERKLVSYALEKEKTTRKAAEYLGITQAKLMRVKKKYDL